MPSLELHGFVFFFFNFTKSHKTDVVASVNWQNLESSRRCVSGHACEGYFAFLCLNFTYVYMCVPAGLYVHCMCAAPT